MFWRTDVIRPAARRSRTLAVACAALGPIGCANSGDKLLGTIESIPAPPDAGSGGQRCTTQTFPVQDVGLDLFFIVDRSNAVDSTLPIFFQRFLLAGEVYGMGAGLVTYPAFPFPSATCISACTDCECLERACDCSCDRRTTKCIQGGTLSCEPTNYHPVKDPNSGVPIGRLPANFSELYTMVSRPWWGPATLSPALEGALDYIGPWETANPGRNVVQVLIAGTSPDDACSSNDVAAAIEILGPARPKTYVIAFDTEDSELDLFAQAGRTGTAVRILIDPRRPPPQYTQILDLVRRIRATDGRCEYVLPSSVTDVDYEHINLAATAEIDGGSILTTFKQVRGPDTCRDATFGWYYDNPNQPTRLHACPETCAAIHAEPSASIEISVGCQTVKADPAGAP